MGQVSIPTTKDYISFCFRVAAAVGVFTSVVVVSHLLDRLFLVQRTQFSNLD